MVRFLLSLFSQLRRTTMRNYDWWNRLTEAERLVVLERLVAEARR